MSGKISEREQELQARVEALERQLSEASKGETGFLIVAPIPDYQAKGVYGCDFVNGLCFIPSTFKSQHFATVEQLCAEFKDWGYRVETVADSAELKPRYQARAQEAEALRDRGREKIENFYSAPMRMGGITR